MSAESLHLQVSSALNRLETLRRRVGQLSTDPPKILQQVLRELEQSLEELQAAREHLIEQRDELSTIRRQLEIERQKYWQLFDGAPDAYVVTPPDVQIVEANRAAAELLNISQRFLVGKNLSVFVCTERSRMLTQAMHLAQAGGSADWVFSLRPRERAPLRVAARVVAASEPMDPSLRWMLRKVDRAIIGDELAAMS